MRKSTFIVAVVLILLASSMAWGQATTSLESTVSFGLFTNAYDSAFNPSDAVTSGPTFTGLQKNYLFGGLTNFPLTLTATTAGTVVSPITMGYYSAGSKPWSALLSLQNTLSASLVSDTTTYTTASTPITSGTTTTNHVWTTSSTNNSYAYQNANNFVGFGQVLVGKLGPMNAGLYLFVQSQQNASTTIPIATWAANNLTTTVTNYYDTTPGAVPTPKTNYTDTIVNTGPDTLTTIDGKIPFFMPLGTMGLTGSLEGIYSSADQSTSTKETVTAPQAAGAVSFNGLPDNSTTNKTSSIVVNGAATLTLPALIGKNKADRFDVGLTGNLTVNTSGDLLTQTITQDYNAAGGGAALTLGNNGTTTYSTSDTTRAATTGYTVNLNAQHYFYFQIAEPLTLGIAPNLTTGVSWAPASYNSKLVQVTKTDGNGDGLYNNAADTIVTTTTTYGGNTSNGTMGITAQITLPTAIKFTPKGWPFGVTLGNQMIAGVIFNKTTTDSATSSTSVVTTDGTGAAISTVNTTAGAATTSSTNTPVWIFNTQNSLALNFYLPGNTSLDVILNGSNFFTFDNFTIQAIVPLP